MDPLKQIAALLSDPSPRKRIAAAVVLGELGVKDAGVVSQLVALAKDPVDAYAEAGVEALGRLKALKALPVLFDALSRGRDVREKAKEAIAALGEDALPELRKRLEDAPPEVRAELSALLPSVGGRQSFELALEGLREQSWDAVNRVALSVRHEARAASEAERKVMRTQVEKFLAKKKTAEDETALRGALKILGYLELPDAQDTLLGWLGVKQPTAVRVEAVTSLRFALAKGPTRKALRRVMELLLDADAEVSRAARDTLTVLNIGAELAGELAELCGSPQAEVALWAITHLGALAAGRGPAERAGEAGVGARAKPSGAAKLAAKTLLPVAAGADRARAEAAARVLAALDGGAALLAEALAMAEAEPGAQVVAEQLTPLASKLSKKELQGLLDAGTKNLGKALAVARRQLEPVRAADPGGWAEALRDKRKALEKKDPARAELIAELLGRSAVATAADRYAMAARQFLHQSLDPHPRARQRDPALAELEKLHAEGFPVAATVAKDKQLSDEARYYVGVHFAEKVQFDLKNVGAELLEGLAGGKGKLATAAKNKLELLEL